MKQRYGGSVKRTSHAKAIRFRLHHKGGILHVIRDLQGLLQNPTRINQMERVCTLYGVQMQMQMQIQPILKLDYMSGYLSGLFDSDGSVYYNRLSQQIFITVSQKNRYLLDVVASVYGGKVYSSGAPCKGNAFKWIISKKSDVLLSKAQLLKLVLYFLKDSLF